MRFHLFYDNAGCREDCEKYLTRYFDFISMSPHARAPQPGHDGRAADLALLRAAQGVAHGGRGAGREGLYRRAMCWTSTAKCGVRISSPAARTWACSRAWAIRRTSAAIFVWTNTLPTAGQLTVGIPPTPPAGGAAHIPSPCWTSAWCITAKSPPTTRTAAAWKCTATIASLLTDTEVIAYMLDYLVRRQGLTLEGGCGGGGRSFLVGRSTGSAEKAAQAHDASAQPLLPPC